MLTRRTFAASLAATFVTLPPALSRMATPSPGTDPAGVTTVKVQDVLWEDVMLDHYRVVDLASDIPGSSVVIGAMVNTGSDPVEVPFGIDIVIRDGDGVIIGAELLIPDYPILPVNEPMGFHSLPARIPFDDIDATRVVLDVKAAHWMESGEVERLRSQTVDIVSAKDVSANDESIEIELEITNTSDLDFDNGVDPRISVWDRHGLYCGNSFANVFHRLPAGESARFTTQTNGSIPNPRPLAGNEYTWKAWVAPR